MDAQAARQVGNLIVNYLPTTINDADLRNLFAVFGTVETVKVVVDKSAGTSLGYGFVKFASDEEAQKAIDAMNGYQIGSKVLKVSFARTPTMDIKNSNVYVAGLGPAFPKDHLDRIFGQFGAIVESKLLKDPSTGLGRGVAFVRYNKSSEAEAAIATLNGAVLEGTASPITVKLATQKMAPSSAAAAMGGSAASARFSPYYVVPPSAATQYMPGVVAQPTSAQYAAAAAMAQAYPGYTPAPYDFSGLTMTPGGMAMLAAAPTVPTLAPAPTAAHTIFIYNVSAECDESVLYQLFTPFGAVTNTRVIRDPATGLSKGYGFVSMPDIIAAQSAITALNGKQFGTKTLQVSFKTSKK